MTGRSDQPNQWRKIQLINLEGVTGEGQHVMDLSSSVYVIGAWGGITVYDAGP